jgi:DNA-binding winged helix-turn-helix (wHTH) protein
VLKYLAEHSDRVVSKDELLEAVWPDVFTSDGVLKKAISQARHALCDDPRAAKFIETYHRRGYRFIAPVQRSARPHS